ncbi:arsenate reductase/protein-tyrosine-phosphatase family protein [Agromyces bauzanensis]
MRRAERRAARPFSILTVCTGNICRSPLAEQLLRARLCEAGLSGVEVGSAGLRAVVGARMDTIPARISSRLGGDPSRAVGQQLTAEIVAASDLVLTMTRDQRDDLARRHPSAVHRTFTLIEFTRLLGVIGDSSTQLGVAGSAESATATRLASIVASAARQRPSVRLTDDDDVIDPIDRSEAVHEAVGEQISLATSRIVFGLR